MKTKKVKGGAMPQGDSTDKRERSAQNHTEPICDGALPLAVCALLFLLSLISLIIDSFIYPFGGELLAPVILQLIGLVIPTYLAITVVYPDKSLFVQMKEVGFCKIRSEHVFFIIFTSLFTVCASLALLLMLGGAPDAARGLTIMGVFVAGADEYSVSAPYLILTYALIPALAEELLFRGVVHHRFAKALPVVPAAIISATAFGVAHGELISSVGAGVCGFVLGLLYSKSNTVLVPIAFHVAFNAAGFAAMYIPESGGWEIGLTVLSDAVFIFGCVMFIIYKKSEKTNGDIENETL